LVSGGLFRRRRVFVFDKVTQYRFFVVAITADTGVETRNILLNLDDIFNFVWFHLELFGELLDRRLAVELLSHASLGSQQLVDRLHHVNWDSNRPRLVGDSTGNRLTNPPSSVGRKLKALVWIEFFDGTK